MRRPQDDTAGALREETHYDGRRMSCYAQRPASLLAMFDGLVARFGDRPAIVEEASISYRDLDRLTRIVGANLSALGVAPGDRVALCLGNSWEFLAVLFACVRIGAIVVPIGARQRHAELEFMLNDSSAKVLVHEADLAEFIPAPTEIPGVAHRFSIRAAASGARPFDELLEDGAACPAHTWWCRRAPRSARRTCAPFARSGSPTTRRRNSSPCDRSLCRATPTERY